MSAPARRPAAGLLPCGCPARPELAARVGLFGLRHSLNLPSCAAGVHHHAEGRIVLPLGPGFETTHGARTCAVEAGAAVYRPAGDEHVDRYRAPIASVAVLLPGADELPAGGAPFVARDPGLLGAAHALRAELGAPDAASALVAEGIALLAATIVLQRHPLVERGAPRWVQRVRERLHDDPCATPTLAELARSVDRDPTHVAATFKHVYGRSVGTTLRHLRLWQARACIAAEPQATLAEIALRCGFADQSHFGRHFKRLFRLSPGEYRLRYQRPSPARSP